MSLYPPWDIPKQNHTDKIVGWTLFIIVMLAFVLPLAFGIGRWMWDWAIENDHVDQQEQIDG